ncbi:TolC family protein [Skermanella mucosa]|uniref:TolC family protein n=1 Tax=Skermanella mucosa TaxID=1789672 RepID=UPI00192B183F|nr:TolC family protein [Skermanella mucosa]UEM23506.1 TolC family protein [Skermanella mucosa]
MIRLQQALSCLLLALLPFTLAVPAHGQAMDGGAFDPVAMVRLAASGSATGVRRLLDSLAPREITLGIVADTLLRENFGLLAAREAINAAGTQITQKEAAFDLNLVSSVSLSFNKTADRFETIGRPRTADTDLTRDDDGDGIPDFVQGNTGTVEEVDGEKVPCVFEDDELINGGVGPGLCGQEPQYSEREEAASLEGPPTKRLTTTVGVSKMFAFGGQGSLSISSIFNSKAGAQAPALTRPISATDPFGWGDKLFWTSSASLSATMPLPYTKGFGKTGSPENFGVEAARSGSRRAVFAEQAARNATLAEAAQLYWDMIRSLQDIRILNEQKAVLDQRRARIERLIGTGTVTNYELGQIQQELASFALREEAAWTQYLLRSNSLLTLMSADPDLVLIPADAEALLSESVPEPPTDAYDRALVGHPEIMAAQEDLELAKLSLAFRDNQAAPDIDLVVTAQLTQSDLSFGFGNPADALMNLSRPDKTNIFIGVRYLYPLGNQAARAALSRARIDERNAFDRARQTRQKIVNSVDRALADIRGAESLMLVSRGDMELAGFAYERIVDERERGLATEFEVVNRYQDVLAARLNEASARVEMHKAWIRLSAAQGTLEEDLSR